MNVEAPELTVLLVDDEENILRSLQRLLMDEDFEVVTASSGEAALERLSGLVNVGLIVSDQRMPGMNGAEFLGRSREMAPDAQRILLTGYSDINATIDAINRGGASRYISKPWDDDELLAAIRSALDLYRQGVEKRRLDEILGQQNQELEAWNDGLKKRLLQTAATIREQSQALKIYEEKAPLTLITTAFDRFFEMMGDRPALHSRTVCSMVTDVARKMGLDSETIASFRMAALLHDIGKFGTLATSLVKHLEEMSESETNEYQLHPVRGAEMLAAIDDCAAVAPLIRSHHEAYNGSGFPDGLSCDAIPLGARLIAIADFIEKSARSVEHHRAEYAMMNAGYYSGTLFDPYLVNKFHGITQAIYFERKRSGAVSEVEIGPMELVPGMIVSRDVESGAGVLLMQRGSILDSAGVALVRSHFRKYPSGHGIYIQVVEE